MQVPLFLVIYGRGSWLLFTTVVLRNCSLKKVYMALTIQILVPAGTVTYTEGAGGVHHLVVKYYFANVVDIIIYFDDLYTKRYYQIPCILSTPAP
jgi:hypothetical protein